MRSEHAANEALSALPQDPFARAAVLRYRQVDDCYRIGQPIATRTYWQRIWAAICNWL